MKKSAIAVLCAALVLLPGCASMSKLLSGTLIGAGSGAALGAGVGALIGKDGKSTAIGAAVGTAVGASVGAIIGNKMDKKAEELAAKMAKVETITDRNGLTAIKVTFESGILFNTNSSTLSDEAKAALTDFAATIADMEDADLTIWGHTDNTGSDATNEKLSKKRADAVQEYLAGCGIAADRLFAEGKSYSLPVADNDTAEGRAQNRRVEIYITASEEMIEAAAAQVE